MYKSGSTRFDLTSVYYGLQLQLAVYLNAAMDMESREGGEVHPAGMFYYHIEDPMLDYEEEEDTERRMLKELAFNGLVNADPDTIWAVGFTGGRSVSKLNPKVVNR